MGKLSELPVKIEKRMEAEKLMWELQAEAAEARIQKLEGEVKLLKQDIGQMTYSRPVGPYWAGLS